MFLLILISWLIFEVACQDAESTPLIPGISLSPFPGGVQGVQFDERGVGWLVSDGVLYRATDGGKKQWDDVTSRLPGGFSPVTRVSVSPVDADLVYAFNGAGDSAVSSDGGTTWSPGTTNLLDVIWHPSVSMMWLELRASPGCAAAAAVAAATGGSSSASASSSDQVSTVDTAAAGFECFSELHVTRDQGKSFSIIVTYVRQAAWGATWIGSGASGVGASSSNSNLVKRIFVTMWHDKTGHAADKSKDELLLVYSDDYFASQPVQLATAVNDFLLNEHFLVAVRAAPDAPGGRSRLRIMTANDPNSLVLLEAFVPLQPEFDARHYSLLHSDHGVLVVGVQYSNDPWGTLFVSDSDGVNFTPVLDHVVTPTRNRFEFSVMHSDGLFLANVADNARVNVVPARSPLGTTRTPANFGRRTVVSASRGGHWRPLLQRPGGRPLRLDWWASPPGEVSGAPGLIVANGELDAGLATEADAAPHTFVSRDFGFTWDSLVERDGRGGAHLASSTMNGAALLLVAVEDAHQALVSFDHGKTFSTLALEAGVLARPEIVPVWRGRAASFALWSGAAFYHIDIGALALAPCFATASLDDPASDFEAFVTHDPYDDSSRCLMGSATTWVRRKADRQCYATDQITPAPTQVPCECHQHDFECNFGFAPDARAPSGCGLAFPNPPAQCPPGTTYRMYPKRKVPGDRCTGGLDAASAAAPVELSCPLTNECSCVDSLHGSCTTPFHCQCDPGWFGDNCELEAGFCVDDASVNQSPAPAASPSSSGGTSGTGDSDQSKQAPVCVHGSCVTIDYCRCEDGWVGALCDIPASSVPGAPGSTLPGGTIAGIVIVVLLALVCAAGFVLWFLQRKKSTLIRA